MINRTAIKNAIQAGLKRSRVVALSGPRQCGKKNLARDEEKFAPLLNLLYIRNKKEYNLN